MSLTEKYAEDINGLLYCYDRINVKCVAGQFGYGSGMEQFFNGIGKRFFDFVNVFKPVTEQIVANAERIAEENGVEIEFIRSPKSFGRKDERIDKILEERGNHDGLVKIYAQMETVNSYRAWTDKTTKKTSFLPATTKCKVYYFYFVDKTLGLCFVKVPTVAPFVCTVYFNGHDWLEKQLQKKNIAYQKLENAFTYIEDFDAAQSICDSLRVEDIHQVLDIFMARYCPLPPEWNLRWFFTISQCEYSLDIIFREQDKLKPIYDNIVKTAFHTITPENIATFLGKRLTVKFEGEMGSRYNERVLGTRIKHQMGELSVKIYDKFGKILRIEVTAYDVSKLTMFRDVFKRNGDIEHKPAPVKKEIYSLFGLMDVFKHIIKRYLEFVSSFDDPTAGIKKLDSVTGKKQVNGKNVKGLNFFDKDDEKILLTIANGKFVINGLKSKHLKAAFPDLKPWKISNILKRLRNLGLIRKASKSYKYYVTELGKSIFAAGLHLKNQVIVPALAIS